MKDKEPEKVTKKQKEKKKSYRPRVPVVTKEINAIL